MLELLDKCMKMNIEEVPTVDEILYELPFYKHSLPVRYPDNDIPSTYWVEKDNKKLNITIIKISVKSSKTFK